MLIRKAASSPIASSEITPKAAFLAGVPQDPEAPARRRFLTTAATLAAGGLANTLLPKRAFADKLTTTPQQNLAPGETITAEAKATTYNNFYEFGEDKSEPARNAHTLRTRPWTVAVTGMVKKPQTLDIDTIAHYRPMEERVYRHRCVEAWSMVIPWDGYSLSQFISAMEPLPSAKYVQFVSLVDRKQMPDLPGGYNWPYSEGLRIDEAMNPLALLCFGCYGETLPNQNGAPIRVILPWKYGFKSAKSIVRIHFTDKQPHTTWNDQGASEYGFYSNVNPNVDHPRWSQAHERRIDTGVFPHNIPTKMFNGYSDQVASLYTGMDLKKYY